MARELPHGTPTKAAQRWLEADTRLRSEWLHHLLKRDDVRVFVGAYVGDPDPEEVARCAEAAGLGLDDIDVGLLAHMIAARPEGRTHVGLSTRWVERA